MIRGVLFLGLLLIWRGAWSAPGPLVPVNATWRYAAISGGTGPAGWLRAGFDDSGWPSGRAGFSVGLYGYDQAATVVPVFVGGVPVKSLLLRHEWRLDDPASIEWLALKLDYEDGVVGWLNGEEIFRRGLPTGGPITGQEQPTVRFSGVAEVVDLTPVRGRLVAGTNVLALQVIDTAQYGATLFAWPELRANFLRGPLVQDITPDRATVFWHQAVPVRSWVEYWDNSPNVDAVVVEIPVSPGTNSSVTLTGLSSGTPYRYRVGLEGAAGRVWSEPAVFRTATRSGDVDFLVFGDSGSGGRAQHAVADAMRRVRTDLVLHTGDISYPVFSADQIDLRCFSVYEPMMREVPFYFTVGNHDFYQGDAAYLEAFWLPKNSETGTEHYYSFDHGDAHFVSLFVPWFGVSQFGNLLPDGSRSRPYRWLTNDLATTTKPWKFVFFHQPVRTSGPHILDDYDVDGRPDVVSIRETLLPVFSEYRVSAVFCGHDHGWERFSPDQGVQLVVTGGGGAVPYALYRRDPKSAQFASVHHFTRVRLRGREAHVEAIDENGRIVDEFRILHPTDSAVEGSMTSMWRTPVAVADELRNEDGNVPGQVFDLVGEPRTGVSGMNSNPGRLVVNHDGQRIHFGLRDVMLGPGQTLALWVEAPGRVGLEKLSGLGAINANGLSRLPVTFDGFRPGWVFLLGDEKADRTLPVFQRRGAAAGLGQGVYVADASMTPVWGALVEQFNRSPEREPVPDEENADFVVVSVPRTELGAGAADGVLRVAGMVVGPEAGPNGVVGLGLDTAFIGRDFRRSSSGEWVLKPLEVRLGGGPEADMDGDGLSDADERQLGTNPRHIDSDQDRLPDGWEIAHRLNPLSEVGDDGGEGDVDVDGYSNEEEFLSGSDPRDSGPVLKVRASGPRHRLRLEWRAMVGREYDVQVASRLPGEFISARLPGFPRRASASNEVVVLDASLLGRQAGWYRIQETR